MTTPIASYRYNNGAQRWTNVQTGRFVPEAQVVNEMRVHQEATFAALDGLTNALYDGSITVQQWQVGVAQELKDAHLAQAMFGVGGKSNMTAANYGRVGGTLADEYRYLTRFAGDIASGSQSRAQALARIKQYGRATQQSYWREYAGSSERVRWQLNPAEHCGDCIDLSSGGSRGDGTYTWDELPTVPGAGSTQCRGNCKCTLERVA